MDIIDKFVDYLIEENCNGCTDCEPKLSDEWNINKEWCINQGEARFFINSAKRFKELMEKQNRHRETPCIWITLEPNVAYRCSHCMATIITADIKKSPVCPICGKAMEGIWEQHE